MNDLKGNQQDDFEFKPLTKGLGFHPKKESTLSSPSFKSSAATPIPAVKTSPKIASQNMNASPTARSLRLDTPLPRPEPRRSPAQPSVADQTVNNILKNLNDKNRSLSFQDKSQALSPYVQTTPSLFAGFLDLLLITALGLLYLMTLIFTLKLDLIKSIADGGAQVWLATAAVFLVVGFIYYVAQRMFVGFTLGEWAYEQRMGLPEEMNKSTFGLKVFYRQILIMATGIILVPLFSWALGRDLGGISGLCTYRKR